MEYRQPGSRSERASRCRASGLSPAPRATARHLPPRLCRVTSRPPLRSEFHFVYLLFLSSSPVPQSRVFHSIFCACVLFVRIRALRFQRSFPTRSRLPPAGICIFSRCLSEDHSCPIFLPPGLHFPNRPRNFSLAPCAPSRLTPNFLAFWTLSERSPSSGAPVAKTQHTNAHPPPPDTNTDTPCFRKLEICTCTSCF